MFTFHSSLNGQFLDRFYITALDSCKLEYGLLKVLVGLIDYLLFLGNLYHENI